MPATHGHLRSYESNNSTFAAVNARNSSNVAPIPTFALLLTTCNIEGRMLNDKRRPPGRPKITLNHLYTEVIRWWSKQALPLYVVDSSGVGFGNLLINNTNVQFYSYSQPAVIARFHDSTRGELLSLREAHKHWKKDWEEKAVDYIIKVTGRYRLPGLGNALEQITRKDFDFILQNQTKTTPDGHRPPDYQNTEILGFSRLGFDALLERLISVGPQAPCSISAPECTFRFDGWPENASSLETRVGIVSSELGRAVFRLPQIVVPDELAAPAASGSYRGNLSRKLVHKN